MWAGVTGLYEPSDWPASLAGCLSRRPALFLVSRQVKNCGETHTAAHVRQGAIYTGRQHGQHGSYSLQPWVFNVGFLIQETLY